jgi:hypothetical protein
VPGEWYSPGAPGGTTPQPPRKRPKWLIPAGAAAAVLVIAVVLVLTLGSSSSNKNAGSSTSAPPTQSASAVATPTTGNLQVSQFQVGDCLTGANLQLNQNTPWPKLSLAVPCSQAHTAEVFYANDYYWSKNTAFPGGQAVAQAASAECNKAFQSYVGIAYSQSRYTWTVTVPNQSSWPAGDRAMHCMAYYKTSAVPSGETMHGSIKGTAK